MEADKKYVANDEDEGCNELRFGLECVHDRKISLFDQCTVHVRILPTALPIGTTHDPIIKSNRTTMASCLGHHIVVLL